MTSKLGAMRLLNASGFAREIRRAMKASGGRIDDAARVLGVSRRQLQRWLALPELKGVPRAPASVHRVRSLDTNVIAESSGRQ